jgi:hypothetical protein
MMKKFALFVFNGDPMCFIHVLLNALDMKAKGNDVKLVVEGSATQLIPELAKEDHMLFGLWEKVKQQALVEGVCKACSKKMGTADAAWAQGLALLEDMSGHPGMAAYTEQGYEIIAF